MGQGQAENEVTKGSQGPEMCSAVNRGRRPPHPLGDTHFTVSALYTLHGTQACTGPQHPITHGQAAFRRLSERLPRVPSLAP